MMGALHNPQFWDLKTTVVERRTEDCGAGSGSSDAHFREKCTDIGCLDLCTLKLCEGCNRESI